MLFLNKCTAASRIENSSYTYLNVFAVLLLISSGCVSSSKPPSGPSLEQLAANDSINNAVEKYNNYLSLFNKFQNELDSANSYGVDTSSLTSTVTKINDILRDAKSNIDLANRYYSAKQYSNVNFVTQNTVISLGSLDSLFDQANALLKSSYDNTIANYKKKIQDSAMEISVASAYVQDAKNSGVDVQKLNSDLSVASNFLENAKNYFSKLEFIKIDGYLNDVSAKTKKIKDDAFYAKKDYLTSMAIAEVKRVIKTDEANKIIGEAVAKKNQGKFQDALTLLNKALLADVFEEYKSNKRKLIDYSQGKNVQLDIDPINSIELEIKSNLDKGEYSEATKLISNYKEKTEQALGASAKVMNAKLASDALDGVAYLGIKTNPLKAMQLYNNAAYELEKGRYSEARAYAEQSIAEAQKEKENFYSQIKASTIKKLLSTILSIFGKAPPPIDFKTVEVISLSWPEIPETLVNIDLSPPRINVETGKLQSISSPTVSIPILKTTTESKPVDFSLEIPEPSYTVSLLSGISVSGTASIKNTGDQTAHNVRVRFELFSNDGKMIKLSGKDYIEKSVGELNGGSRKSETIDFSIGIGDGQNIQSNGAKAIYNIYSTEKSKTIEEKFKP